MESHRVTLRADSLDMRVSIIGTGYVGIQQVTCVLKSETAPVVMPTYPVPMIETRMSKESALNVTR